MRLEFYFALQAVPNLHIMYIKHENNTPKIVKIINNLMFDLNIVRCLLKCAFGNTKIKDRYKK